MLMVHNVHNNDLPAAMDAMAQRVKCILAAKSNPKGIWEKDPHFCNSLLLLSDSGLGWSGKSVTKTTAIS